MTGGPPLRRKHVKFSTCRRQRSQRRRRDANDIESQGLTGDPRVGKEILTYDDLLQIVELIKSAESFSEFHLKVGDIELDLRKAGTGSSAAPQAINAFAP